jgi:nicotinamidase-related amidase
MDGLLIVDLQQGLLDGDAKRDLAGLIERVDRLARRVRAGGGRVVFVQHDGGPGDAFEPSTPGWELLDGLSVAPGDLRVRKTRNDAFFGTTLQSDLRRAGVDRVLVAGWATDFCVDATVRSAVALGFRVIAVADGHTLSDRPHASAEGVIEHHHWIWRGLLGDHPVAIKPAAELP